MMDPATGDFAKDDPVEHIKQRPVTSAVIICQAVRQSAL